MFNGCSSLKSITMLATGTVTTTEVGSSWVAGIPSGGTLTKAVGATLNSGVVPTGWMTVEK